MRKWCHPCCWTLLCHVNDIIILDERVGIHMARELCWTSLGGLRVFVLYMGPHRYTHKDEAYKNILRVSIRSSRFFCSNRLIFLASMCIIDDNIVKIVYRLPIGHNYYLGIVLSWCLHVHFLFDFHNNSINITIRGLIIDHWSRLIVLLCLAPSRSSSTRHKTTYRGNLIRWMILHVAAGSSSSYLAEDWLDFTRSTYDR